jgi:GGDEF domain-containing protein
MVPPGYRDALKSVLRRSIRSGKAVEPVELVGLRSNGQTFPILLECAPTRMNDEPCTQIIVRDATPEKSVYNQQLEEMLKFDEITGLYSRRFFLEALEIEHDGFLLYILFTDHSAVRHGMGFEALEQFMREAAGLLKPMLSPEDMAAYFASEVFTVYLPDRSSTDSRRWPSASARPLPNTISKSMADCLQRPAASGSTMHTATGKTPFRFSLTLIAPAKQPARKAAIRLRPTRRPRRRRVGGVAAPKPSAKRMKPPSA